MTKKEQKCRFLGENQRIFDQNSSKYAIIEQGSEYSHYNSQIHWSVRINTAIYSEAWL